VPRPVVALTVLAALLRLPTLGAQSLWLDETLTGRMMRGGLRELLERGLVSRRAGYVLAALVPAER
jgi:predicted membrane-bound mannosyltransferase